MCCLKIYGVGSDQLLIVHYDFYTKICLLISVEYKFIVLGEICPPHYIVTSRPTSYLMCKIKYESDPYS